MNVHQLRYAHNLNQQILECYMLIELEWNDIQIEKELTENMLNNKSNHEEKDGVKISVALDQILDEQKWKNDINIVGTKYKYDNPYIIDIRDKYQYFTEAKMDKLRSIGYDQPFYSLEGSAIIQIMLVV